MSALALGSVGELARGRALVGEPVRVLARVHHRKALEPVPGWVGELVPHRKALARGQIVGLALARHKMEQARAPGLHKRGLALDNLELGWAFHSLLDWLPENYSGLALNRWVLSFDPLQRGTSLPCLSRFGRLDFRLPGSRPSFAGGKS